MSARTTVITVKELDCASEEQVLRKALASQAGISSLSFDIMRKRITVVHDATEVSIDELLVKVRRAGMTPNLIEPKPRITRESPTETDLSDGPGGDSVTEPRRPRWRAPALLAASGVAALTAEGMSFAGFSESSWQVIALSIASILLGGLPTLRKGWVAVRTFTLNINFLMTVAVVGACVVGAWPEAAMVTFLFAVAELIERKALDRARNAVRSLMTMAPDSASVKQPDGSWKQVPAGEIATGAVVQVKPGERLALDGVVVAGASSVNQAPVTGESVPVDKGPGDKVFAGTINESGVLEFETTGGKDQTTLAKIIRTVQEAQSSRAPTQRFVDNFARVYTPIVCIAAVLIAIAPWLLWGQPFMPWFYKALVLLVIACPCALVISTPVTIVSGLTAAAKRGILIKGGVYLESGRRLSVIALDKTGTITEGKPRVTHVEPLSGADKDRVLRVAASLDALSQHPIAQAVTAAWSGALEPATDFRSLTGRGVEGKIGNEMHFVGNHRLAEERGVCSPEVEALLGHFESKGMTAVVVASMTRVLGVIAVADTYREHSVAAIRDLHAMSIQTLMISGDNQTTADFIAKRVGIDRARGGMLPEDKLAVIQELVREHGESVGMVGDGVNDAPALAASTIGFAMGAAGTDTAIETADVILMRDDLRALPEFLELSRRAGAILKQNITLAIGIKIVFFVLTVIGIGTMWMAVVADVGASLIVVLNGLRLARIRK